MKLKFFLLSLFCSFSFLQAQTSTQAAFVLGSISGKVIDKNSKLPIPYVNVSVKLEGKIITGGITQDNGSFTIKNLELKDYSVEF